MEELIKALTRAANAVAAYYEGGVQPNLPLEEKPAAEKKPRAPRKTKEVAAEVVAPAAPAAETSPFVDIPVAVEGPKAPVEDVVESKRRCQEVVGLFIRRYQKTTPSGLDRAKAILTEVCGRPIAKLEDLTHADNVKLILRFEKELEKAA